ncbi:hypothetical protein JTB14_032360 [Gonioctena quinquepunctata]|nr:hypothetical protein JTB14_032360 [Gonioctena quinquepunctata]
MEEPQTASKLPPKDLRNLRFHDLFMKITFELDARPDDLQLGCGELQTFSDICIKIVFVSEENEMESSRPTTIA